MRPPTSGRVGSSRGTAGCNSWQLVTAIDDRGQEQQSITFLGTFSRCDDPTPPKQFVSGKTYQSCLAYLIPGGGSIQKVQWDNGPAAANAVTPYFDRPIVWG